MEMWVSNNPPNCIILLKIWKCEFQITHQTVPYIFKFQTREIAIPKIARRFGGRFKNIQNFHWKPFQTSNFFFFFLQNSKPKYSPLYNLSLSLSRSLSDLIVLELVLNTERKSSTIFLRIPTNLRYFSISKLPSLISTKCFSLSLSLSLCFWILINN